MKKWQCTVCRYIHEGDEPPEKCPICGVPASKFVLLEEGDAAAPAAKPAPARPKAVKPPAAAAKAPPRETATEAATEAEDVKPVPGPEKKPLTGYEKLMHFLVRHHAHPVSVHMPNGILPVSVVLFILAWFSGSAFLVKAGFVNLIFVILSLPFVLFTGVLEWKKKYNGGLTAIFKVKILAAALTTASCLISVVWYIIDPNVISSPRAWVFILVNLVMLAAAGVAGHIGGKLVFKD